MPTTHPTPVFHGPVHAHWREMAAAKGFDLIARINDRYHLHLRCRTCGGSAMAMDSMCKRDRPAYRDPSELAADIWSMARWSRGPVFVLGDIRFGGDNYAETFLSKVKGATDQLILEVLTPAPQAFFKMLGEAAPDFILQMSPESHDEKVRAAFGRTYNNEELEATIAAALAEGCKRFDLFFTQIFHLLKRHIFLE